MRLWSIDFKYLDTKGLVACWREGLLAQKVLKGETKGYKNHSQLVRFKNCKYPVGMIGWYLNFLWLEAFNRKFKFNRSLVDKNDKYLGDEIIQVTQGQLDYEFKHLQNKLVHRDFNQYSLNYFNYQNVEKVLPNKFFKNWVIDGGIQEWEKI